LNTYSLVHEKKNIAYPDAIPTLASMHGLSYIVTVCSLWCSLRGATAVLDLGRLQRRRLVQRRNAPQFAFNNTGRWTCLVLVTPSVKRNWCAGKNSSVISVFIDQTCRFQRSRIPLVSSISLTLSYLMSIYYNIDEN
jgi:hypothetical protein